MQKLTVFGRALALGPLLVACGGAVDSEGPSSGSVGSAEGEPAAAAMPTTSEGTSMPGGSTSPEPGGATPTTGGSAAPETVAPSGSEGPETQPSGGGAPSSELPEVVAPTMVTPLGEVETTIAQEGCPSALSDAEVLALDPSPLSLEVQGRLCDDTPAWIAIEHGGDRAAFRMALVDYSGPLGVEVFQQEDDGSLQRIPDVRELGVHPVDGSHADWFIARRFGRAATNALYLRVAGTAGPFALALADVVLDERLDCDPQYEGTPVRTEPMELPGVFVTDLCSARDSRVVSFQVYGGRSFGVTLENPEAMATMDVGIVLADQSYELFPIDSGVNEATMGLYGESEIRFTPSEDGMAAVYIGSGQSLAEQAHLRIEQRR